MIKTYMNPDFHFSFAIAPMAQGGLMDGFKWKYATAADADTIYVCYKCVPLAAIRIDKNKSTKENVQKCHDYVNTFGYLAEWIRQLLSNGPSHWDESLRVSPTHTETLLHTFKNIDEAKSWEFEELPELRKTWKAPRFEIFQLNNRAVRIDTRPDLVVYADINPPKLDLPRLNDRLQKEST